MSSRSATPKVVFVFLIIGCWLRVWGIGVNSLWFDEVFTRNVVVYNHSLFDIARSQVLMDLHPPLYFVLLAAWTRMAGDSEVSLRMLSALIAMLGIPAFYHIGRLLFNRRTGTIALILVALSPLQIYYGQEARNYILSVTLAAWMLVGLLGILRGKRYGPLLYLAAGIAGLYTHYFNGLLLAALHGWLLLYAPARKRWRVWLVCDLAIALLFVPQLTTFLRESQAVLGSFWIPKPNPAAPITTLTFLLFGMSLPAGVDVIGIVGVIVALAIAALDMLRQAPRRVRSNWLFCVGTVALVLFSIMLVSYARSSIYLDKSFALLSPLLIVALAAGAAYARRPSPAPILVVALGALMLVGILNHALLPDPAKPPFRQIAADLMQQPDATTTPILYLHDSIPLSIDYYAPPLTTKAHVVDLGNRSWLWPQDSLFPQTWQLFGIQRFSRSDIAAWLAEYHGKLRAFTTPFLEPPEQDTLTMLLRTCESRFEDYRAGIRLYEFTCP